MVTCKNIRIKYVAAFSYPAFFPVASSYDLLGNIKKTFITSRTSCGRYELVPYAGTYLTHLRRKYKACLLRPTPAREKLHFEVKEIKDEINL